MKLCVDSRADWDARDYNHSEAEAYELLSRQDFDEVPDDPSQEDLPRLPWNKREMVARLPSRTKAPWWAYAEEFISGTCFQATMALIIVGNALVIGLETDLPELPWWNTVEEVFLVIFAGELLLKLTVLGPRRYFDSDDKDFTWNVFDFFVVSLGGVDAALSHMPGAHSNSGGSATLFRSIRLLRILRIFRIVRFLRQLYMLAFGLALAATAIFWVTFLMTFVVYVCSIILVRTLGRSDADSPLHDFLTMKFGSIRQSMLTLFELMTQPDMTPYHDVFNAYPLFTPFFISFVVFGSFGMIALLTGVISESMFVKNQLKIEEERQEREMMRRMMVKACDEMFERVPTDEEGDTSLEEIVKLIPEIEKLFENLGVVFTHHDFHGMIDTMDQDGSGTFSKDEFFRGILKMSEGIRPISIIEIRSDVSYIKAFLRRHLGDSAAHNWKEPMSPFPPMSPDPPGSPSGRGSPQPMYGNAAPWTHSQPGSFNNTADITNRHSQELAAISRDIAELRGTMMAMQNTCLSQGRELSELTNEVREMLRGRTRG